jgi:hypothetical protein
MDVDVQKITFSTCKTEFGRALVHVIQRQEPVKHAVSSWLPTDLDWVCRLHFSAYTELTIELFSKPRGLRILPHNRILCVFKGNMQIYLEPPCSALHGAPRLDMPPIWEYRIPHGGPLPKLSESYCLDTAGLSSGNLAVSVYKRDRIYVISNLDDANNPPEITPKTDIIPGPNVVRFGGRTFFWWVRQQSNQRQLHIISQNMRRESLNFVCMLRELRVKVENR